MDYRFINTEYLDSVSGGDNEIIIEIVAIFREQVSEIYSEMQALLTEKNYHALGMLAHKAKSSVAIMGMNDLAMMLKTFELQAKEEKESGEYTYYISKFRNDTYQALIELDDLIKTRKSRIS